MDINRATTSTQEDIDDVFEYHSWNAEQIEKGKTVRRILGDAFAIIIGTVPPCPDRSSALRKIREARMDCNSAITHGGKY